MKKNLVWLFFGSTILHSCSNVFNKTISGNGRFNEERRNVGSADKIRSYGNFNVTILQGSSPSVKIEADENLIPYILTENKAMRLLYMQERTIILNRAIKSELL